MITEYSVERWSSTDIPDPHSLRQTMTNDGYAVFEWSDSPGTVYEMGSHSDDQSHWIISGRLELMIEWVGRSVLGAGDRDFMPAGTRHSARVVGNEKVHYLIGSKG